MMSCDFLGLLVLFELMGVIGYIPKGRSYRSSFISSHRKHGACCWRPIALRHGKNSRFGCLHVLMYPLFRATFGGLGRSNKSLFCASDSR